MLSIFVKLIKIFVHNEILYSVVTYLIFEFSFRHALYILIGLYRPIRVHSAYTVYMKMHYNFLLNIKHGASQLYLGPKYNCEAPGEGPPPRGLQLSSAGTNCACSVRRRG